MLTLKDIVTSEFGKETGNKLLTLKDHVAGMAEFQYYRAGNLMYKTSTGLEFPIPVSDTNDATFPRTEKGIFFMRWIRKHLLELDPNYGKPPKTMKLAQDVRQLVEDNIL